jgi:flagellar basal body P-ring protein FlgI
MAKPFTNQRPGSVVVSRQVAVKDFYVASTPQNFEVVQPKNTIVESVHVFFDGATEIDGYGAGTAGDMLLTIGTNSDYSGTEIVTAKTVIDATADDTIDDGDVVSCTGNIAAAAQAGCPTDDRVLYGRLTCGDASTITGTNKLQIHIGFRQF